MKKISVNKLIEFRRKSYKGRLSIVEKIKSTKIEVPLEGGGDYWVSGLSAICNSFKENNLKLIEAKTAELEEKIVSTKLSTTRNMYLRNIAILKKYKDFDIRRIRPREKITGVKKSTGNPLLTIKGLQIETKPSYVYTFGKQGEEKVGAVWFVAKIDEYSVEEIGIFCEMLYRFLKQNHSKKYEVSSRYCVVIDVWSGLGVDYSQLEKGTVSQLLIPTLEEFIKLM